MKPSANNDGNTSFASVEGATAAKRSLDVWRSNSGAMRLQLTIHDGHRRTSMTWFRDGSFHFQTWAQHADVGAPHVCGLDIIYGVEREGSIRWHCGYDQTIERWGPEIDELLELRSRELPEGTYDL